MNVQVKLYPEENKGTMNIQLNWGLFTAICDVSTIHLKDEDGCEWDQTIANFTHVYTGHACVPLNINSFLTNPIYKVFKEAAIYTFDEYFIFAPQVKEAVLVDDTFEETPAYAYQHRIENM